MIVIDKNGAHFDWIECDKKGLLGNCRHEIIHRDNYDLNDVQQRQEFFNMDMVIMKRPEPPTP